MPSSCPYKAIEECPGQDETREPSKQSTGPELERSPEVPASAEERKSCSSRLRRDVEDVDKEDGEKREEDVKEEAAVGFEPEDAGGDAEQGRCETLQI